MEARITFYDIKKVGYYTFGQNEPIFWGLSELLDDLKDWAKDGRSLENTTTFQAAPDRDIMRTFFIDSIKNETNGDYILSLWNEVQNDDGKIYGVRPHQLPGEAEILQGGFDGEAIPGFPSYYWFIDKLNVFATIKFDHSMQGKLPLDRYLSGFLANKSSCRVLDRDDKIVGYSLLGEFEEGCEKNHPRFEAKATKNSHLESELLANIAQIRKFVRKEYLLYSSEDDRPLIERLFSSLLDNTPTFTRSREISQEIAFEPDVNQLRRIIHNYYGNENESIKNVGFVYNSGKRVMLNGMKVTFKYDLDVVRHNDNAINVEDMNRALCVSRGDLLAYIEGLVESS